MACHECDLLVDVPELKPGEKAYCPRCDYLLAANRPHSETKIFAYSITALVFLALANMFPFISLAASGKEQTVTLMGSIAILFTEDNRMLAAIVFASIVLVPAVLLSGIIYVSVSIRSQHELPGVRQLLRWGMYLAPWSMAEIFLIGILVSFIKIAAMADVGLGLSFWAYSLFTIGMVLVTINFDRREVWHLLDHGFPQAEAKS